MVLLLLSAAALPAAADDLAPDDLLERLAPDDGAIASAYVQTRESGLLTETVRTAGEIHYRSPRTLEKTERSDAGERTVHIADGTVRMVGEEDERRFPLTRSRELVALVELLEAVATADAELLRERFDVVTQGTDADWRLALEQHAAGSGSRGDATEEPLRVVVVGAHDEVHEIRLDAPDRGRLRIELRGAAD